MITTTKKGHFIPLSLTILTCLELIKLTNNFVETKCDDTSLATYYQISFERWCHVNENLTWDPSTQEE